MITLLHLAVLHSLLAEVLNQVGQTGREVHTHKTSNHVHVIWTKQPYKYSTQGDMTSRILGMRLWLGCSPLGHVLLLL